MPKQGGRVGRAALALVGSALLLSLAGAPAVAQTGTTAAPPPSSFQADCGGGGSTQGYPDASPTAAADLFTQSFPCLLDSLTTDPSGSSGSQASGAQDEAGGDALAGDSSQSAPFMTTDESGASVPVDLSLEPAADGFQPAAPLVALTLPADLGDQVAFGDQGIAIDMGATDPQVAATSSAKSFADGKGLFYAGAAPATDVALAPVSHGLEATYQLRAPESPEHLEMALTLPDGASLQSAGSGGAWVVQGGNVLADFSPPLAFDAAGNPVEATLSVSGDSLELDLPDSDSSTTYPIAVTTMVTSLSAGAPASAAATTTPKLGYNTIQLQNVLDPNGNFVTAKNGNATWFRGGPEMQEDSDNQNTYVARAAYVGLKVLYVIPHPGGKWVSGNTTPAQYTNVCETYANQHSNADAFEVMNEPNTLGRKQGVTIGGEPWSVDRYAKYAIHCEQGIRLATVGEDPPVPVLAASVERNTPSNEGLTWYEWLDEFGHDTQNAGSDLIISSHIYPEGQELTAPTYAAFAVETYVALDRIYTGADWGVDRDLWITETGVYDQDLALKRVLPYPGPAVCGATYKPEYLKQMFLKAGDNSAYDVGKVFIYRFTRNGSDSATRTAGVYDATDPFLNQSPDCGFSKLANTVDPGP